jgi:hypothetical protein
MSSPDKSERSADAPISDYAPKWAGGIYRQGSPDTVKGEQPPSGRNLEILRFGTPVAEFRKTTLRVSDNSFIIA